MKSSLSGAMAMINVSSSNDNDLKTSFLTFSSHVAVKVRTGTPTRRLLKFKTSRYTGLKSSPLSIQIAFIQSSYSLIQLNDNENYIMQ